MSAAEIVEELHELGSPQRAADVARFFKTGPGQYGEGDVFLGVPVPLQRRIAKRHAALPLSDVRQLLLSPVHECRLTALLILVSQYQRRGPEDRLRIYDLYMAHTARINNWDLVDSSAEFIVGPQIGTDTRTLKRLAHSSDIWERRIAMLACFHAIKLGNPEPALTVISILKNDPHDLIQKAVGWMLREIGKRCSRQTLVDWLLQDKQYARLPRTVLRYAIEHFSPDERQAYLRGTA